MSSQNSIRIYQPVSLTVQKEMQLDEKGSHHLARVLRAKIGDSIILFNNEGGEYEAVITHINKKNVSVTIENFRARHVESPIDIYLAQGIARGEKMDFIVQKAVELGVKKIIPLITERSNMKFNKTQIDKRLEHWQAVAISACEQSGRNTIPEIAMPIFLQKWLQETKEGNRFILTPHVKNAVSFTNVKKNLPFILLIGPEGGFSDEEEKAAINAGFLAFKLGPRILRTETASIAAVSILQNICGDFN